MGNPRSNDGILDAPKYKYEPILADSTSRILILKNGYYEDELAGDLEMAKLDECPPWKALSYAWGTTTTYARIKIGTGYVRISANLEAALRRLRQAYGDEAPGARVRLWIDQICIDQENIQERSQQVQLMYDIYKQAEKVLVWLGPDDICVAGKAFAAIRLIASLDEDQARTIRDEGLGASVPPLELEPVKALFDCRWFSRLWVVQEVGMDTPVEVHWGQERIEFAVLYDACQTIRTYIWAAANEQGMGYFQAIGLYQSFVRTRQTAASYSADFAQELYSFSKATRKECLDPRDRVFALLGHYSARIGPDKHLIMQADYSAPSPVVY